MASLIQLLGFKADVVCYSKILSDRDFNDFRALFDELDQIEDIQYGTFVEISNKMINKDGDIRDICKKFLIDPQNVKFENQN